MGSSRSACRRQATPPPASSTSMRSRPASRREPAWTTHWFRELLASGAARDEKRRCMGSGRCRQARLRSRNLPRPPGRVCALLLPRYSCAPLPHCGGVFADFAVAPCGALDWGALLVATFDRLLVQGTVATLQRSCG